LTQIGTGYAILTRCGANVLQKEQNMGMRKLSDKSFKYHVAKIKAAQYFSKRDIITLTSAINNKADYAQAAELLMLLEGCNLPTEQGILLRYECVSTTFSGQYHMPVFRQSAIAS
jgi:hypothetical protein